MMIRVMEIFIKTFLRTDRNWREKHDKIAVDAMGGDNAPGEIVKGAVDAVTERNDITVCLTGQKDAIEKELSKFTYKKEQIEIVDAPEVIETGEPPVNAIRKKKNSSSWSV